MKKMIVLAALAACAAGAVQAQESPWMVRFRATNLGMENKNETTLTGLAASDKTIPEVDISYFFNKNLAAELILTVPQKHDVNTSTAHLGTFKHLPPTLLAQYHFTNFTGFKPYVGAGINYTKISSVQLIPGATLDNHSWGFAYQAGVDIPLDKNWSLNFDLKKIHIKSNVYLNGDNLGTLKLNPVAASVGVGYRF